MKKFIIQGKIFIKQSSHEISSYNIVETKQHSPPYPLKIFKKILDSYVYYVIISMLLYAVLANAGLRGEGIECQRSELKIMNL